MASPNSFKLPKAFLSQLGEFTTGYFLVTVNNEGQFETFFQSDNPITRLGMLKFSGMVLDTLEASLGQAMANPQPEPPPSPTHSDIEITDDDDDDEEFG